MPEERSAGLKGRRAQPVNMVARGDGSVKAPGDPMQGEGGVRKKDETRKDLDTRMKVHDAVVEDAALMGQVEEESNLQKFCDWSRIEPGDGRSRRKLCK